MKISIDGGALSSRTKYGNYVFSENLILALQKYDHENECTIYTLDDAPSRFKGGENFKFKKLSPRTFWSTVRIPLEEALSPKDVHLALNQSAPQTKARTISFLHGLSFHYFPELYPDSAPKMQGQLNNLVKKSDWIVVSSIRVKNELLKIYPKLKNIVVIPFGIPFDMRDPVTPKIAQKYFLYVGMDHKIKNLDFIRECFYKFKRANKEYKLQQVSDLNDRKKLKELFSGATAYLSASLYESFNLPILESLTQGTPVIALETAIIPEYKKYVNVAKSENHFLELMKLAAEGKLRVKNISQLKNEFSWKTYVQKLTDLYNA